MYTIETEISEELLIQIDERVEQVHAQSRAEYVLRLINHDIATAKSEAPLSLREILAPVHAESADMTQEELDAFSDEFIKTVRAERRAKMANS